MLELLKTIYLTNNKYEILILNSIYFSLSDVKEGL